MIGGDAGHDVVLRDAEPLAHRAGREGVADVVSARAVQLGGNAGVTMHDVKADGGAVIGDVLRVVVRSGIFHHERNDGMIRQLHGSQQLIVVVQEQRAASGHLAGHGQLLLQDVLFGSEDLEVRLLYVGNDRGVRHAGIHGVGHGALVLDAELLHEELGVARQALHVVEQRVDGVLVAAAASGHVPSAKHLVDHILGRGLADRTGDAHHVHADVVANAGGEDLHRLVGTLDDDVGHGAQLWVALKLRAQKGHGHTLLS